MASFELSIITPKGHVYHDSVDSVRVPGVEGSFGILRRHAPIVSTLTEGLVFISKNQSITYCVISTGIFEVNHQNKCLLLTDDAMMTDSKEEALDILKKLESQSTLQN